jgi:CubicO group peptidase (beta-lactamase class C family)
MRANSPEIVIELDLSFTKGQPWQHCGSDDCARAGGLVRGAARLALVVATALTWNAAVDAAPLSDSQYAALVARFQSAVDAERTRYSVPGITAAFVLPDGRMAKVASGFADVERKIPMTPDSRMLSGSTGKTLAAAVAMKLSQQVPGSAFFTL